MRNGRQGAFADAEAPFFRPGKEIQMKTVEKTSTNETKNNPTMTQDIQSVNREQMGTRFAMYRDALAGVEGVCHERV